ncbi:MAG: phage virion morphogenesis protein [Deltaproteobacteria bacterium]|nr:phage virion morphogenesis protein [Deltaproteobacteria bacterium]
MLTITVDDHNLRDMLARLQGRISDLTPAMRSIGEEMVERIKQRFASSTAPDGAKWQPNTPATIEAYLRKFGGTRKKDGSISKRGQRMAANKRPLIGETKALSTTIYYRADSSSVTIGSPMRYAAIHQFGGQAGRGRKVTIPARPYLPIDQHGRWIGEVDRQAVYQQIIEYILAE